MDFLFKLCHCDFGDFVCSFEFSIAVFNCVLFLALGNRGSSDLGFYLPPSEPCV